MTAKYVRYLTLADSCLRLARDTLRMETLLPKSLCTYRQSIARSLSGCFELLSGVFCELSRLQDCEEPSGEAWDREHMRLTPWKRSKLYIDTCSQVIASLSDRRKGPYPFTAMYVEAQNVMHQLNAFASPREK